MSNVDRLGETPVRHVSFDEHTVASDSPVPPIVAATGSVAHTGEPVLSHGADSFSKLKGELKVAFATALEHPVKKVKRKPAGASIIEASDGEIYI